MATTERDYYELLGIARDASADDVKRAFRRLAREVHPDVSDAPNAEHRFREVVEAYEVLSNSERRELYDRFGHAGLRSGGFQPSAFDLGSLSDLFSAFFGDDLFGGGGRMGRARGADIAARVEIDLAEVATGAKRDVPFIGFDFSRPELDLHLHDHGDSRGSLRRPGAPTVEIEGSPEFNHWVVWALAGKDFICLEPWTAPGNALNTRVGLLMLPPGGVHTARVAITATRSR